jgi:hypothetical protein
MTTFFGLGSIANPLGLLEELRRVVHGRLLAVTTFYPPDDEPNLDALRTRGLLGAMLRESTVEAFARAGWGIGLRNGCHAEARPTPDGKDGATVSGGPVL